MTASWVLYVTLVFAAFLPRAAHALSSSEVNEQSQSWFSLNTTARIADRWGFVGDVHVRRTDFAEDPSFYFLRGGAHYWITKKVAATFGYAHMWKAPAREDWDTWSDEERIYEQVQHVSDIGPVHVLNRLRNEQRWQEIVENDEITRGYSFSNRVRYLLSFTIPVSRNPVVPAPVLSDEVLLQFGPAVDKNVFDQNRSFIGIKERLSRSWSFDFGFMPVLQQKSGGDEYDLNDTLRLFFYFTPDVRSSSFPIEPAGNDE